MGGPQGASRDLAGPRVAPTADRFRAGGVGAGVFKDFNVVDRFIKIESEQMPNEQNRQQYLKMMPIFDDCYHALENIYEKLAKI